jgi:Sec-independent protein translocase protein TatA
MYKKTKHNLTEWLKTCLTHIKIIKDSFTEETKVFIDEAREEFRQEKQKKQKQRETDSEE